MHTTSPTSWQFVFRLLGASLAILTSMIGASLRAQEPVVRGTVTGVVADSTGKFLEGAEISIDGTPLRTTTARNGTFVLRGVPAGTASVTIQYPGMEPETVTATVVAGESVALTPVRLASETVMLSEFRVQGAREGMAQAQALQKVAVQYKLVAASDQFGEVSEGNIGEYLKFLPGVGIDYNSNDARGISLRGLRTNFTIVAVDGTPMASAASGGDSRRFELEQIAMNNVETTEIFKTVTPDIQADATGGFINMVTKSAFDREDVSVFSYNLSLNVPSTAVEFDKQNGTWGHGEHYNIRPSLEANYARRVTDKLGVNINYRLSEIYHDSPRTEYTWTLSGTGVSLQDPTLRTFVQNNEQKLTHRESLAAKIDYKLSDRTTATFSGQWNWYDLTFTQRAIAFDFGTSGMLNLPGADSSASGTNRAIRNQYLQRNKYGTTLHFNGTLSHDFENDSRAWLTGYWSRANSKYRDATKGFVANANASYVNVPSFQIDNALGKHTLPDITLGGGVPLETVRDLANYQLSPNNTNDFRSRPDTGIDTKTGANAHYRFELGNLPFPLALQVGAALDTAERTIDRRNIRADGLATSLTVGNGLLPQADYLFDYDYGFGRSEVADIYALYDRYGSALTRISTWDVRAFDENNIAGYFRADATLLPDLLLIGGVRWEQREIDAVGQNRANARSLPVPVNLKYDDWYPSLTLKYTPGFARQFVLRAGASRTVGHPDYGELLPTFTAPAQPGTGDGTLTVPDRGLKPYFVNNYDVVLEYYPSRSGVASISLFRKEVKGFIVSELIDPASPEAQALFNEYNLDPDDYLTVTRRVNGNNSKLHGLELLYNQSFPFLPKPFDGLNLQLNYTLIDIDADDLETQYAQEQAAVTEAFNVVVGYRYGKWNATISTNWTTDVLTGTEGSGTGRVVRYKEPETKTSIKLEYAISPRARVYGEVRNIFYVRNEYLRGYLPADQGITLPGRYFEYGDPIYVLGVKGTF